MKCEMCDREDAQFCEFVGAVSANLCPLHKTDVHTYITTELPITEFTQLHMETRQAASDPVLFKTVHPNFLDVELIMHKGIKKYIYGSDGILKLGHYLKAVGIDD